MNLISKMLNSILIPYHSSNSRDYSGNYDYLLSINAQYDHVKDFSYVVRLIDKRKKERQFNLNFIPLGSFDKDKKTVVFFHGNAGIGGIDLHSDFADDEYNYLIMEYLPYRHDKCMKDIDVNLELLVNTSEQMICHLDNTLSSDGYYGNNYKRNEKLILCCYSLGSMVGVKVAANFAKKNTTNEKTFYALLSYCSPVDLCLFMKGTFYPLFILSDIGISLLLAFLVVYPVSIGIFYSKIHKISQCAVLALAPAFSAFVVVFVALFILFPSVGKKIGIQKEDIESLKYII